MVLNKSFIFLIFIVTKCSLVAMEATYDCMTFEQWQRIGNTPLHDAIMDEQTEEALELIKQKKYINDRNQCAQYTPLFCAAIRDNYNILRALLDLEVDVKAKDYNGKCAWQYLYMPHAPPDILEKMRKIPQSQSLGVRPPVKQDDLALMKTSLLREQRKSPKTLYLPAVVDWLLAEWGNKRLPKQEQVFIDLLKLEVEEAKRSLPKITDE